MKPSDLAAWTNLLNSASIQMCALLHDILIGAIDAQIHRKDHPTPRYRELIDLETRLIARVNKLGGYPS